MQRILSESEEIRSIACNNRGNSYAEKGEHAKAIEDYTNAIRLNPEYATAYINRRFSYVAKGDFERAKKDYTEAIRLDPKYANLLTT